MVMPNIRKNLELYVVLERTIRGKIANITHHVIEPKKSLHNSQYSFRTVKSYNYMNRYRSLSVLVMNPNSIWWGSNKWYFE